MFGKNKLFHLILNATAALAQETIDQLMDFVEKYLMTRLYRAMFAPVTTDDEDRDLATQARIRSLHWINIHLLDAQLNESREDVREIIDMAITGVYSFLDHLHRCHKA